MYKVDINVDDVEDDYLHLFSETYETKICPTAISSELVIDAIEDLEEQMAKIYKRIKKWVEWIVTQKKRTKGASAQSTPDKGTSQIISASVTSVPPMPKGPTQPLGGGDQPPKKDKEIEKDCQDGSVQVMKLEVEVEKMKSEEEKQVPVMVVVTQVLPMLTTTVTPIHPIPTPTVTPVQTAPVPPPVTNIPLPIITSMQIVDVDDGSSSESESMEFDEEEKKAIVESYTQL